VKGVGCRFELVVTCTSVTPRWSWRSEALRCTLVSQPPDEEGTELTIEIALT